MKRASEQLSRVSSGYKEISATAALPLRLRHVKVFIFQLLRALLAHGVG